MNRYCKYGCGKEAKFQLLNGSWICSKSANQCLVNRTKNSKSIKQNYANGRKSAFLKVNKERRGKTFEDIFGKESYRIKQKISSSLKGKSTGVGSSKEIETKRRQKIKEKIEKRYAEGWEAVCGRSKKYDYESPIAGKIKVDGTWELEVAKYFDKLGINWVRNKKRFTYTNLKGKTSTYCPDFYVKDWSSYIEVKGYQTKNDELKWEQFPYKLEVWKKEKLRELGMLKRRGAGAG